MHGTRVETAVVPGHPEQGPAEVSSWRDVSPRTYRLANLISVPLGVVLLASGMWALAHAHLGRGLAFVVVGFVLGVWTAFLRIHGMPAALHKEGRRPEEIGTRQGKRDGAETWSPRVIHFYTRQNCTLCDEAKTRMMADLGDAPVTVIDHDVGEDTGLETMYGHEVPVAIYDGKTVFSLRYDPGAVKAAASHAKGEAA